MGDLRRGRRRPGLWPWTQALDGLVRRVGVARARAAAGDLGRRLGIDRPGPRDDRSSQQSEPSEQSEREQLLLLDASRRLSTRRRAPGPPPARRPAVGRRLLPCTCSVPRAARRPAPVLILGAYRHDELAHPSGTAGRAGRASRPRAPDRADRGVVAPPGRRHGGPAAADRAADASTVAPTATRSSPGSCPSCGHGGAGGPRRPVPPAAVRDAVTAASPAPAATRGLVDGSAVGGRCCPTCWWQRPGATPQTSTPRWPRRPPAGMLVRGAGHSVSPTTSTGRRSPPGAGPRPPGPAPLVADALEQRLARGAEVPAADLAAHHRAAPPSAGTGPAVTWALRAAADDLAALALAEAATHLRRLRPPAAGGHRAAPTRRSSTSCSPRPTPSPRAGVPGRARPAARRA